MTLAINMSWQPVFLWSDLLLLLLLAAVGLLNWVSLRRETLRRQWRRVGRDALGMAAATVLALFVLVGLLDSAHYRLPLPATAEARVVYGVEVYSLLDRLLWPLKTQTEKTYSAPLATQLFAKEAIDGAGRD